MEASLEKERPTGPGKRAAEVLRLQRQVGNQAVQRLMAQRRGDGSFELDEQTASQINQARGGGQTLDGPVQTRMSQAMGHDFSNVRVHTSPEADTLNRQLSAKAFTTGQDVFFKQGEYNPGSSSGQELIAHELTHVVQQSSGAVGSYGGGMTVTAPNDVYEQEADSMAKSVSGPETQVQRQEEEELAQMKRDEALQRQEEEEELAQMKVDDTAQRQEEEEELAQMKVDDMAQRQEEEELAQ
jgi:hypothetical protein